MYVVPNRRCEVSGCTNEGNVIEIHFYIGAVKRMCPQCIGKALALAMKRRP